MPGGGRKKRLCPETTASGVATRAEVLNTMPTSDTTDNVPPAERYLCQRAAKFMREVTEATNCFEDEVEAESRALRADNAALTARLEVATKTVKRSKALAVKYYDLCVVGGVDLQVLDGVDAQVSVGQQSDEEAEEHAEEMEEPDEEAVFGVEKGNAEEVEEQQQHVPP